MLSFGLVMMLAAAPLEPVAPVAPAVTPNQLAYSPPVDVTLTATFAALWLSSEYGFKKAVAPSACRWCATNGLDLGARGIRSTTESGRHTADIISGALAYVTIPVASIGLDWLFTWQGGGSWKDGAVDALLILEAVMLSQVVNQTVKFIAGRERPFVAELPAEEKGLTSQPTDNNLSFYSGHAAFSFSLVAASATVAKLRGYSKWWVILAAGVPLATTTAVLRMVADKHYFTDVLAGAAFGSVIGLGLPLLFHRPIEVGSLQAHVVPSGTGVSLVGRF